MTLVLFRGKLKRLLALNDIVFYKILISFYRILIIALDCTY